MTIMPTNFSDVDGSEVLVEVSANDLDYQRKRIVLIASVIGLLVFVIMFARLFWGLWTNRKVLQKIYQRQANPRHWCDDGSRQGNGQCTTEALFAMEEGKSAEMPKEMQMKKDDLSDEFEKMLVEMKKVPEESFLMLLEENQSREEARPMLMKMEKSRV